MAGRGRPGGIADLGGGFPVSGLQRDGVGFDRWARWWVVGWVAGCGLAEQPDLLVGRPCTPRASECDPGQRCLPHARTEDGFERFLCRDRRSFETVWGTELRAFCDEAAGYLCPEGIACRPDRIRRDEPIRPRVCKLPDDPFGPPTEGE